MPVVVLVSGSGSLLQALLDATADPGYGVRVAAVGADRPCEGLARADRAGVATFVCRTADFPSRALWDAGLAAQVRSHRPALVVSAGFLKLIGPDLLGEHTVIHTHPALLPSSPGLHGVSEALAYDVRESGTTAHVVDSGVDTGPIIEQRAVDVRPEDTEESLHERIKVEERRMLVDVVGRIARGWSINGRKVDTGV